MPLDEQELFNLLINLPSKLRDLDSVKIPREIAQLICSKFGTPPARKLPDLKSITEILRRFRQIELFLANEPQDSSERLEMTVNAYAQAILKLLQEER